MRVHKQFSFFFAVVMSCGALADEGVHTSIHRHYQAPRALGMGGAFVAVADDYSTLFYNPAGLAELSEAHMNFSVDAAVSVDSLQKFFADIDAASQSTDSTTKFNEINKVLMSAYGRQFSFRTGLLHGITAFPGWGLAVLPADFTMDVKVHNQGAPALNLRAFADTTLAFGVGRRLKTEALFGKLSWGVTGKFVNRGYANKQANAFDLVRDASIFSGDDLRWGYTTDIDFGLLYSPVVPTDGFWSFLRSARPTFGFTARNLIDGGFGKALAGQNKTAVEPPEKLGRAYDLGVKFELPRWWIFAWRFAFDVQDIGHPSFNQKKGIHAGAEFDWRMASWWRGSYRLGAYQGYPSLGASFLLGVFRLDLVTYGEDYGSYDQPRENRLYLMKLNIDI